MQSHPNGRCDTIALASQQKTEPRMRACFSYLARLTERLALECS